MFDVNEIAITKIKDFLTRDEKKFFRISVEGGGCSGFKYQFDLSNESNKEDTILSKNGVNILIDPVSLPFLEDSILNFEETLGSSGFKVANNLATARCGCGISFSI